MTSQRDQNSAKPTSNDKAAERSQRQAAQLRANLQRRKEQVRQRGALGETDD